MVNKTIGMSSYSGQKSSNFAQTCNLLSQYMKEKGGFGDFGLGIPAKHEGPATTMNLLPNLENVCAEFSKQNIGASTSVLKASDFFPGISSFGCSSNLLEDPNNQADHFRKPAATMEHGTSPMTIFYAGQVLVFENFPAEKAREILALAGKLSGSTPVNTSSPGFAAVANGADKASSSRAVTPDLNIASPTPGSNSIVSQDRLIQQLKPPQAIVSDLPIARRASLHRFLEKRKGRAIARAPYQVDGSFSAHPEAEESKRPWLLEAQSSKQLDLKL